jgi:hypothetical protein
MGFFGDFQKEKKLTALIPAAKNISAGRTE